MKRVTWTGGPGSLFNAENVTLSAGESRVVADELADRLLAADEHAPNPGQLEVREWAELPRGPAKDATTETVRPRNPTAPPTSI